MIRMEKIEKELKEIKKTLEEVCEIVTRIEALLDCVHMDVEDLQSR